MQTWLRRLAGGACLAASTSVTGCGFYVPTIEPLASSQLEVGRIVNDIANHIGCEIGNAVSAVHQRYRTPELAAEIAWLDTWAAKITLSIVVQEKTDFAPGISFKTLFSNATTTFGTQTITSAQSFSFGIGGQFSSEATRTENVGYFVSSGALRKRVETGMALNPPRPCHHGEGPNIEGDLKFREWLEATILPTQSPGTTGQLPILTDASLQAQPAVVGAAEAKRTAKPAGAATTALTTEAPKPPPFDIISHEVNFVVVAGGNITPTWTLVTFSANTGNSPLIGATRTRTNNVLITMGRTVNGEAGSVLPSQAVEFQHLSSQIKSVQVVSP